MLQSILKNSRVVHNNVLQIKFHPFFTNLTNTYVNKFLAFSVLNKMPHDRVNNDYKILKNTKLQNDAENDLVIFDNIPMKRNVLAPAVSQDDVDFISPMLKPTYNLAAYVDKSVILSKFLHLGVEIAKWEKHKDICLYLLKLEFEEDIKPYIFFLHDIGVPIEGLGRWLTINPFVFKERLTDLQIRINYLYSKKFNKEQIGIIIKKAPKWINFSTQEIDKELGIYQDAFKLKGDEVRSLAVMDPKLIVFTIENKYYLRRMLLAVRNEMGFTKEEAKSLLLSFPRFYRTHGDSVLKRFDVLHTQMGLSLETIAKFPKVFSIRHHKLKERHLFLKFLHRNQYNPLKPGYVAPYDFINWSDNEFCLNVACSTTAIYNDFLKTL